MTPKQILDSFSDTLMQDERILSAQERTLLSALLQHASHYRGANQNTQEAVRAVIASAVGETVAQRAFGVLGGSIVERLLETCPPVERMNEVLSGHRDPMGGPGFPTPPSPGEPQGPGVKAPHKEPMGGPGFPTPPSPGEPQGPGVKAPHREPMGGPGFPTPPSPGEPQGPGVKAPHREPMGGPGFPTPPSPGEPQGPGVKAPRKEVPVKGATTAELASTGVAVAERPESLLGRCVVLDEFLAPQELEALTSFTIEHEADFRTSEVVSPNAERGVVNYEQRRSRVLMDAGPHEGVILERIKSVLPQVLEKLGMEPFTIAMTEAQITASNDGDYFHFHSDSGNGPVAARTLTFVYFFHREPRQFEGGELRIHDAQLTDGIYASEGSYQAIDPQQNQIVFFRSELMHEVTPVKCSSGLFADSRFTLNGWLRK